MAKKLPAMNAARRILLVRLLLLVMIWGGTIFAWGSLAAWQKARAESDLRGQLSSMIPPVQSWLEQPAQTLEPLLADETLQQAVLSPLGLAGPAAQRALNGYALQFPDDDVALIDVTAGRVLSPPGAGRMPPEIIKKLEQLGDAAPLWVVASGTRNGVLYYAARLASAEGQRVFAVMARSLRAQVAAWPSAEISPPAGSKVWLTLPHLTGSAWWSPTEPYRLMLTAPLPEGMEGWQTLRGVGEASLGLVHPKPPLIDVGVPQTVLLILAAWGTLMVLWPYTAPARQKLNARVAPLVAPVRAAAAPAVAFVAAQSAKVERLRTKARGRAAAADEMDAPLVSGPGAFRAKDFSTEGHEKVAQARSGKLSNALAARRAAMDALERKMKPPEAVAELSQQAQELTRDKTEEAEQQLAERVIAAFNRGSLQLQYQPMYNTETDLPMINEVLARLKDDKGVISPGEFMPVLGAVGKLAELDAMVFRRIMGEHFSQHKTPPTGLSLNVSGTSLDDIGYLRDMAQRGPDTLKHILLELRSNELVRDPQVLKLVQSLQSLGVKVAVDYFGGGAPMIRASSALGLDYIKFNVQRLTESRSNKKELLELCVLAKELNLPIIGERVEDTAMADFMRRAGASLLQGYGLCPPQNAIATLSLKDRLKTL